jgi:hypothetical protein
MISCRIYGLALVLVFAGCGASSASEFTEACLKAQIFTEKDCTCVDGKASDAEKTEMLVFLTADDVAKQGGAVDQAKAEQGMATMGKHGEACDKEK